MDHITFYKILPLDTNNYELFEFGTDVIQTELIPSKRGPTGIEDARNASGPTLYNGSFIWTTKSEEDSLYTTQQL